MRRYQPKLPKRQRGAVAVVVGLTIFVLVGMIGLALDSGQLFVNKTELQNAADACALAAARELDGNADALSRADNVGVVVGKQNLVGFQDAEVELTSANLRYSEHLSPNDAYQTSANADPAKAKFVMCTVKRSGIGMWFMGVRGFGDQTVGAYAVATLLPAQTSCALPIGFCENKSPAASCPEGGVPDKHGLCVGDWRNGRFEASDGSFGAFNWIDFVDKDGGTSDLGELLITGLCEIPDVSEVKYAEPGVAQAAAKAWNSRFGLYPPGGGTGNPSPTGTPPATADWTGYSYTTTTEGKVAWPAQRNAFADFLAHRVTNDPYQGDKESGLKLTGSYTSIEAPAADRRVVPVPIINCTLWGPGKQVVIEDWACVLMLHPIGNPSSEDVYMEYRGLASTPGSPCASYGLAGGTIGPLIPVLVQ